MRDNMTNNNTVSNLDVMQTDGAVMAKHGRRIDGMLDAMTGASALVRHLLNFSHSRRPEPEVISIAEVLPSLTDLLQVAIGREVDVIIEADDVGPCCVLVDQASFEVAVVHTALQLAASMPGGGAITFDLRKSEPPDDQIALSIQAEPRGTQPDAALHRTDMQLVEHFARVPALLFDQHPFGLGERFSPGLSGRQLRVEPLRRA